MHALIFFLHFCSFEIFFCECSGVQLSTNIHKNNDLVVAPSLVLLLYERALYVKDYRITQHGISSAKLGRFFSKGDDSFEAFFDAVLGSCNIKSVY